jgi:hypothetical protein
MDRFSWTCLLVFNKWSCTLMFNDLFGGLNIIRDIGVNFWNFTLKEANSFWILMHAGMDGTGLGLVLHHKALWK